VDEGVDVTISFDTQTVDLTLVLECEASFEDESGAAAKRAPSDYSKITGIAVQVSIANLIAGAEEIRRAVRLWLISSAEPERGQPRMDQNLLWQLFPELSLEHGQSGFTVVASDHIDRAIRGTFNTFLVGGWIASDGRIGPTLICVEATFAEGSLKTTLKITGQAIGATLALLLAAATTEPGQDIFVRHKITQQISIHYNNERCFANPTIGIEPDFWTTAVAEQFNYEADGISPDERTRRVCAVQMALDLSGFPVGQIDGKDGPKTDGQVQAFAKKHNVVASVRDPSLCRYLALALEDGARSLKR
jgi:hypothetical protein